MTAPAASAFALTREDDAPAEPAARVVQAGGAQPAQRAVRRYNAATGIQAAVPETVGYRERDAVYALENGGFRVRVMDHEVDSPSQDGVVVQQLPRAGTRRVGWTVTIVVGRHG